MRRHRVAADGPGVNLRVVVILQQGFILVQLDSGEEALCDPLPPGITQGGSFTARIVREAIAEIADEVLVLYGGRADEPGLRSILKKAGFLTRDPRVVERKKYGKAKARRSFQFSKR